MSKQPIVPQIFQDYHYLMNDEVITWELLEYEVIRYPIHIIPIYTEHSVECTNEDLVYMEFNLNLS